MPEKDKNPQEGPDIRSNLIKVNMGGDTMFVDPDQYKPQIEHQKKLKRLHRKPKNPKPGEWVSKDYSKHKVAFFDAQSAVYIGLDQQTWYRHPY